MSMSRTEFDDAIDRAIALYVSIESYNMPAAAKAARDVGFSSAWAEETRSCDITAAVVIGSYDKSLGFVEFLPARDKAWAYYQGL